MSSREQLSPKIPAIVDARQRIPAIIDLAWERELPLIAFYSKSRKNLDEFLFLFWEDRGRVSTAELLEVKLLAAKYVWLLEDVLLVYERALNIFSLHPRLQRDNYMPDDYRYSNYRQRYDWYQLSYEKWQLIGRNICRELEVRGG